MIPTHPNYPKRFINEVTFIKDGLWFYLDRYRSATDKQRIVWIQEYKNKKPFYTDPSVKKNEGIWADHEDVSEEELRQRKVWHNNKLITLEEAGYTFINNRPLLPMNSGLGGRGMLGKFGPNHAADPIVTRYNPDTGDLEFVAGLRADTDPPLWCIPGGMVDAGESVSMTLRREFKEEVASKCNENVLDEIFKNGTVLYSGPTYGDPRTTDEAWIETYVVHYHIDNELAKKLTLTPQEGENRKVEWISCNSQNLYGDHKKFIKLAQKNQIYKEYKNNALLILGIVGSIFVTLSIGYYIK